MSTNEDHAQTIALLHEGRLVEAENRLKEALLRTPEDSRALRLLGTICHLTGRPTQATVALEHALELDPENSSTLLNLGGVYLNLQQADKAEQCFTRVIELDPASADGHFNLGLATQHAGRLDDAVRHYTQAIECDPGAIDARLNLAALYLQRGQHEFCIDLSRQVLTREPNQLQARLLLLRALIQLGDLAAADLALTQTPAATTQHFEFKALEGTLHSRYGRQEQAATAYAAALALGDTRSRTALNLAHCLLESGQWLAAIDVLRTLIKRNAGVAEQHELLSLALQGAGDRESALSECERALQLDPKAIHNMTTKAILLFELGRDEAGEQAISEAIACAPTFVGPHMLRIDQQVARGDIAGALATCEHYLRKAGAECSMLATQYFLLHAMGRAQDAATLMDFDGLISTSIITAPDGYTDLAEFNAALTGHILAHPSLSQYNTASKATQHGQQSGNLLFGDRGPFEAFEQVLWREANRYTRELEPDSTHPFRVRPPKLETLNAWAVVLGRSGHQTPHIHPTARLSGVYYPKLPTIIERSDSEQGWIEFGAAPPELAFDPPAPTRRIKPQEGLLVLFPSYFYHRTVPYDSDEARISIAFDFLPGVHRRP